VIGSGSFQAALDQLPSQEALAAANARVAELMNDLKAYDEAIVKGVDQPKRPLLADQPEVFYALVEMIRHIAVHTASHSRDQIEACRKLLVGK
jgi:hypothetical protein